MMGICAADLITRGRTHLDRRLTDAKKLMIKIFRVQLRREFYGDCPGVRADGSSDFSDEIGKELSRMSAEAGLSFPLMSDEKIRYFNIIIERQLTYS
ncbi:Unknown protein, partial [Striga hermonthica]